MNQIKSIMSKKGKLSKNQAILDNIIVMQEESPIRVNKNGVMVVRKK